MKRSELRIIKKRIRNLIVLGILLLGLITAYKIYPTSKSEKIITANLIYIDSLSKEPINLTINTDDYDTGYYFILPNNINGLQVLNFYSQATEESTNQNIIEYQPGTKYYLSQQEIDESKITLNVVYNTKETQQYQSNQPTGPTQTMNKNHLYYKTLETTIAICQKIQILI